jgi:hypothetical protein
MDNCLWPIASNLMQAGIELPPTIITFFIKLITSFVRVFSIDIVKLEFKTLGVRKIKLER